MTSGFVTQARPAYRTAYTWESQMLSYCTVSSASLWQQCIKAIESQHSSCRGSQDVVWMLHVNRRALSISAVALQLQQEGRPMAPDTPSSAARQISCNDVQWLVCIDVVALYSCYHISRCYCWCCCQCCCALFVTGHAVVLVGYGNDNMAWLAINSWVKHTALSQQRLASLRCMAHKHRDSLLVTEQQPACLPG
jgi:hypothetical protein